MRGCVKSVTDRQSDMCRSTLGPLCFVRFQVTTPFSALISNSSTIGDSGVSKALNWVLILRNGRRAFAPGLDPRVFARPF